jgi:hypothetical protein
MKTLVNFIIALLSLSIAILCFGVLFVSCAGHPPQTITNVLGFWIFPVFLLFAGIFLYLSMFYWTALQPTKQMDIEAKLLPKKVLIFFLSFVVASFSFFVFSSGTVFFATNTTLPNWTGYIINALFTCAAIYIGFVTYKKMSKKMFNQSLQRTG